AKVAVFTEKQNVDPVGACVGNRGTRINTIVNELNGEKVDLVEFSEDPLEYIARALSPAKVLSVETNDSLNMSQVIVPDDKLSLAIGKGGQNVRLAARLTGWKIDVKPESYLKPASSEGEAETEYELTELSDDTSFDSMNDLEELEPIENEFGSLDDLD
ncbi:MAG: transcription termination/antitermination protein NusA, partial [Clostridia bacterium]|nr:transcription termination/antitermination protein NusA [Clostridia bacterium]